MELINSGSTNQTKRCVADIEDNNKDVKKKKSIGDNNNTKIQQSSQSRGIGESSREDFRENARFYKVFPLIKDAVTFATANKGLPLFALDKEQRPGAKKISEGAKVFIVASYETIWIKLEKSKLEDRCFYETIMEV
jgi:hypothetical protein